MLKHLKNNFLCIILRKNKGGSYCKKVLGSFKIFSYLQGGGEGQCQTEFLNEASTTHDNAMMNLNYLNFVI